MLRTGSSAAPGSEHKFVSERQSVSRESAYELLLSLRARGVELRATDDQLRVIAQRAVVDDALRRVLRSRKQELLEFLTPRWAHDVREEQQPRHLPPGSRSPLAPAQRRLWLLDRLEPNTTAYSLPYAFRLGGNVDVRALRASFATLLARHETLRTQLVEQGSEVFARYPEDVPFALEVVEVAAGTAQLEQLLARAAARPFSLRGEPLFRASLFVLPDDHVLFFNLHHIVCDGWSVELLLEELLESYSAHRSGRVPDLPAIPMRFAEYATHELERAAGERFRLELTRSVARLSGSEPLELPTDRARPPLFDSRGDTVHFIIDDELVRALEALATRCATTPYVVLLAAYELLLARYSGQHDIVVGSPAAGRDSHESERVVGFFARTLVIRTEIDLDAPFVVLVERVKQSCLAAFEDQHVPFERLVEALNPARDRSRTPLFQTLFSMQGTGPRVDVSGRAWQQLPTSSRGAKCDLTLLLEHDGTHLFGKLEYSSGLFERPTIERLVANYQTLLSSAISEPARSSASLPMVHELELEALEWTNQTARAIADVGGFYELIRAQARRTPDNVAISDQHGDLSYRELDRRSDSWAALLVERGVQRGSRVGVALSRNARVLEVMLGVMKAGAAYVPLDTSFPRERLKYMADDAGVECIVTERESADALPLGFDLLLAEDAALDLAAAAPTVQNSAGDIAYIIYTSGSTGTPKGVEVRHGGVVNLLTSMADVPGCTEHDRVLAVSTFSFDMCIAELYLPLSVGARTILAPRTCAADGATLARFIEDYGATFVQATPTTFKLLVDAGLPRQRFKAIGGGEPFAAQLARELAPCCSEIWNGYGPTETTVYATFYRIDDPERPVLIGKPIANTRLYVLDPQRAQVPFGVVGELYIGGSGVSAGYRNRPQLTSERFLRDPFVNDDSARMYRTGDLVRMRAEGVQYVGRADHQVKLRGYRIELGEIESVLAEHPRVERCAVLVRELALNDQRLVAYVACKDGSPALRDELIAHLERRLPRYMVPRLFVLLDALPMSASGKVERKRLPDPAAPSGEGDAARTPPADSTERMLHEVWQRVLRSDRVGMEDDFFSLGGHSLLAVRLVDEINRAFHTSLSLSLVFDSPTIRAQAARINLGDHTGGVSVVALRRGGTNPPLFCICGINLYQGLADQLDADRPVYGLFLPVEGELFRDASLELDARDMAREYLTALRTVQPHGPYYLAGVSFGGVLAYEIAQQLAAEGEQVALLALLEVILPHARRVSRARRLLRRVRDAAEAAPALLTTVRSKLTTLAWRTRSAQGVEPAQASEAALVDVEQLMDHRMQRYHDALAHYVESMSPYAGDVVLVRGRDQVRAMPGIADDYGWRRYVGGKLTRIDIGGDHLGILAEPHVRQLAARLRRFM
jgi:amino acid adenylation domain-containing protein